LNFGYAAVFVECIFAKTGQYTSEATLSIPFELVNGFSLYSLSLLLHHLPQANRAHRVLVTWSQYHQLDTHPSPKSCSNFIDFVPMRPKTVEILAAFISDVVEPSGFMVWSTTAAISWTRQDANVSLQVAQLGEAEACLHFVMAEDADAESKTCEIRNEGMTRAHPFGQ
jgi:hypothetical protein